MTAIRVGDRRWYRVRFARWHAGGRLFATWIEVPAESAGDALRKAKQFERDQRGARSSTASWAGAGVRFVGFRAVA